jgi:hypothetical protein
MARTGRITVAEKFLPSKALVGAAVLFVLPGLLFWPVRGLKFDLNDWVRIGGVSFFILMAIWARWMPLPASIISLVVYLLFLCMQLLRIAFWTPIIWILNGSILLVLIVALVAAIKRSRANQPNGQ